MQGSTSLLSEEVWI